MKIRKSYLIIVVESKIAFLLREECPWSRALQKNRDVAVYDVNFRTAVQMLKDLKDQDFTVVKARNPRALNYVKPN